MNMYLLGNCASFNSYCSTIAKASFCHYSQAFEHQPTLIIPDLTSSLLRLHCWPHSQTPSRRYYQEIDERWFTLVPICRSRYLVVHSLSVSTVHKQRAAVLFFSGIILNQRVKWLLPKAHSCSAPWGWTGSVGSLL